MTQIYKKLNDSAAARWGALLIVSFTMMCGYFITDVMAPLEDILTKSPAEGGLGWTSDEYGFFSGGYGYINEDKPAKQIELKHKMPSGYDCKNNRLTRFSLGHEIITDVAFIKFMDIEILLM